MPSRVLAARSRRAASFARNARAPEFFSEAARTSSGELVIAAAIQHTLVDRCRGVPVQLLVDDVPRERFERFASGGSACEGPTRFISSPAWDRPWLGADGLLAIVTETVTALHLFFLFWELPCRGLSLNC